MIAKSRTAPPIEENPIGDPAGVPFDLLARLRERVPVAVLADGRYFVSRYDDVSGRAAKDR